MFNFTLQRATFFLIVSVCPGSYAQELSDGTLYGRESLEETGRRTFFHWGVEADPTIWMFVTDRAADQVLRSFDQEIEFQSGRKFNPKKFLRSCMSQSVKSEETSILSLGEGESDFIWSILEQRRDHMISSGLYIGPPESFPYFMSSHIRAVDIAYPENDAFTGAITDDRVPGAHSTAGLMHYSSSPRIAEFIRRYPGSYDSQLFQNLNLRDPFDQRETFDLIISSFALDHVIEGILEEAELAQMMDAILMHMKPCSRLIVYPFLGSSQTELSTTNRTRMWNLLNKLKENSEIDDHNLSGPDDYIPMLVVERRKEGSGCKMAEE
jgi:hypothetical protein